MAKYVELELMYENCIKMAKKFIDAKEVDLAIFWKNAAVNYYKQMHELTLSTVTGECA